MYILWKVIFNIKKNIYIVINLFCFKLLVYVKMNSIVFLRLGLIRYVYIFV